MQKLLLQASQFRPSYSGSSALNQARLSNHEFMMLRALLENGDYREGEPPFWRVSRHWDYRAEFANTAWDACESLKGKGLVLAKAAACQCHRHLNVYTLSDRGRSFIEQANGNEAVALQPESVGKNNLSIRKWTKTLDEFITFLAIALFAGLAVHLVHEMFHLGPGLFGANISPAWFYAVGLAAATTTRLWPAAAPAILRS